ncbi:reverse transcriptase domain-containing protein [Tanacetum coccineum]|uniref:Reverse transcriptase domain-containing protein n=1 Tax=Tanacetum coccineum TaxID=301880 RepID=A0ABQ4ZAW1_9ASTR
MSTKHERKSSKCESLFREDPFLFNNLCGIQVIRRCVFGQEAHEFPHCLPLMVTTVGHPMLLHSSKSSIPDSFGPTIYKCPEWLKQMQLMPAFGAPRAIISDRGTIFGNDQFAKVMLKLRSHHRLSTEYSLQTSGQVEVYQSWLERILERSIGETVPLALLLSKLRARSVEYGAADDKDCNEEWVLYTDGASSAKGSGAGLVLISPTKMEYTYALSLNFESTSNQAEYEALLAGLRIAKKIGVQSLSINVDSKLVASQINDNYEACKENMIRYLNKAKEYIGCFKNFKIQNIPQNKNQKAEVLSKLASVAFNHLTKEFLVETLDAPSMDVEEITAVVEEEGETWMTPIINCLKRGIWPEDQNEAPALRMKINQYVMEEGFLFKISYLMPMLRCVSPLQANYVIREIHIGVCSMHLKARLVVAKAIRQGYYWSTMHRDAREEIRKCDSCQIHSSIPKLPKTLMTSIMAPWPFFQWGMDVLGTLPKVPWKVRFVIVAVDYFTKWIEAKLLAKTIGKEVKKFEWDNIVCRYGLPKIIVMDNGTNFIHDPFKSWCKKLNITQINTAVAHPKANGLVERANRSLMKGIKTRLGRERKGWVDELPNVLWAHKTSLKTSNGETPCNLTFESEVVIPAEISMPTHRTMMIKEGDGNEEEIRLNLDLLTERREAAAIREARYKMKMEQYYNKRVSPMSFKMGEYVYRKNEASRVENLGKLGSKWEGPYLIVEAYQNGSYKLCTMDNREVPRVWLLPMLGERQFSSYIT